jgi:hypothetical protein
LLFRWKARFWDSFGPTCRCLGSPIRWRRDAVLAAWIKRQL